MEGSLPKALSKALNIPWDAFTFACLKSLIMGDEENRDAKNTVCNLEGLVNWFLKCLVMMLAEQELLSVLESSGDPISETLQRKDLGTLTDTKEPQDHFPFPKEENKPEEASVSPHSATQLLEYSDDLVRNEVPRDVLASSECDEKPEEPSGYSEAQRHHNGDSDE